MYRSFLPLSQMNAEVKSSHYLVTSHPGNNNGAIYKCTFLTDFSPIHTRNGRCIELLDFDYTMHLSLAGGSTRNKQIWRVIFFLWTENFVSPAVMSVLESASILSLYTQAHARSVKVLSDDIYHQSSTTIGSTSNCLPENLLVHKKINLNQEVIYSDAGADDGDVQLYCIVITMWDNSNADYCDIESCTRFIEL